MANCFELDLSYLKVLKEFVICAKCKNVMEDPREIITCEHIFCFKCLDHDKCFKCQSQYLERDVIKTDKYTNYLLNLVLTLDAPLAERGYKLDGIPAELLAMLCGVNLEDVVKVRVEKSWAKDGIFVCDAISPRPIKKLTFYRTFGVFHKACKLDNAFQAFEAIEKGLDVNVLNEEKETALHLAVKHQSLHCVKLLLLNGACVDMCNINYSTPLHLAMEIGNNKIIKLLLEYGADKNAIDYYGCLPEEIGSTPKSKKLLKTTEPMDDLPVRYLYYRPSKLFFYYSMGYPKVANSYDYDFTSYRDKNCALLCVGNSVELSDYVVLKFLARGNMIVREKDLHQYLKANLPFVPELIPEEIRSGLLKSIRIHLEKKPLLLSGMKFVLMNHSEPISIFGSLYRKSQLNVLIKRFDGTVLKELSKNYSMSKFKFHPYHSQKCKGMEVCSTFIVYEKNDPPLVTVDLDVVKHVSSEWLLKCVMNYEISNVSLNH